VLDLLNSDTQIEKKLVLCNSAILLTDPQRDVIHHGSYQERRCRQFASYLYRLSLQKLPFLFLAIL